MFTFVILVTFVGSGEVMLATELVLAMLAFERQEIDEAAVLSGTLVSNGEESGRRFGGSRHGCGYRGRVGQSELIYALTKCTRKPSLRQVRWCSGRGRV